MVVGRENNFHCVRTVPRLPAPGTALVNEGVGWRKRQIFSTFLQAANVNWPWASQRVFRLIQSKGLITETSFVIGSPGISGHHSIGADFQALQQTPLEIFWLWAGGGLLSPPPPFRSQHMFGSVLPTFKAK